MGKTTMKACLILAFIAVASAAGLLEPKKANAPPTVLTKVGGSVQASQNAVTGGIKVPVAGAFATSRQNTAPLPAVTRYGGGVQSTQVSVTSEQLPPPTTGPFATSRHGSAFSKDRINVASFIPTVGTRLNPNGAHAATAINPAGVNTV